MLAIGLHMELHRLRGLCQKQLAALSAKIF